MDARGVLQGVWDFREGMFIGSVRAFGAGALIGV